MIDCRGGDERADETIASIRSAGGASRIVTLGGRQRRDIVRCDRPSDLASLGRVEGVWICPMLPVIGSQWVRSTATLQRLADADARLIYADDDLACGGLRTAPHFKPRWNRDLFRPP